MIGDPTHSLTYDFDVFDENDGLAQRGSFIIDPEGKIVVYEGLMQLVSSDDELAVVVGHEVAHAVAKHSNERMSQQLMAQYGAQILGQALSNKSAAVRLWLGRSIRCYVAILTQTRIRGGLYGTGLYGNGRL